jgi:hypothetical protein
MACRDNCGFDTADTKLVYVIQECCDHFAAKYHQRVRLDVTGPNRCLKRNIEEGGSDDSEHLNAKAMDYVISLADGTIITPKEIYDHMDAKYPDTFGQGIYDDRNHTDVRLIKARWDNRT